MVGGAAPVTQAMNDATADAHRPEMHASGFRALLEVGNERLGEASMRELLASHGVKPEEFGDNSAWFSLRLAEAMIEHCEQHGQDPDFHAHVVRAMLSPRHMGPVYPLMRAFGTPGFTYAQMVAFAPRVNKVGSCEVLASSPGRIRLAYRAIPGATAERCGAMCRSRLTQFRELPQALFGLPAASVEHPECMQKGGSACIYDVRWREPKRRLGARLGLGLAGAAGVGLALLLGASPSAAIAIVALSMGIGWALPSLAETRDQLASRTLDVEDHRAALTESTKSNEKRFEELVRAKSAIEEEVAARTHELQQTSERLSDTLKQVQDLDRAKTDFFNNVSHELRSPLTLILAPLEDLVAGRTPAGGTESALEAMRRNANRLLRLINQLLDLAKIDAGEVKLALSLVDLEPFLKTLVSGFEPAALKKQVDLVVRIPPEMAPLAIDSAWIESAVNNLVANALRLTPSGKAIRLTVHDRGDSVAIEVADDGPGIAKEDLGRVFERFAQGDSRKRVVGGTGIGLALVREAARLHGGDVRLVSELGHGASFTLTLPRRLETKQVHAPGIAVSAPAPRRPRSIMVDEFGREVEPTERASAGRHAPLAFVVEDNAELREFVADVLAARYRVRTFSEGRSAFEAARRLKPAVVVSDVAMPEMSGYELCRALRADEETEPIPVLLVTARTEATSVIEGFESGANDYVLKPFHGRELLARVDVHVRLRKVMQDVSMRERQAMLGTVAASVAHQVLNPLTTLVSGLPAMRARLDKPAKQSTYEMLDVMIECSQRIETIVRDLVLFSRVDREASGPFAPSDGLRSVVRVFKARAEHVVTFEERIEDCPTIMGRAGDMNHVFLNLIDNAVRAVESGGRVSVEGFRRDDWYVVRIGDSGPGIDADIADKVFEPFFSTRPAGEGTGLGLAVVRQVLRRCGGRIQLGRSELGGAAFTVEVPLAQPRASMSVAASTYAASA